MLSKIKGVSEIYINNTAWIHVTKNETAQLNVIKKKFGFDESDIDECRPGLQRPKLIEHPDYLFMILEFPYYDRQDRVIRGSELDFFIGRDFLVTVNTDSLKPLDDLWEKIKTNPEYKNKIMNGNPEKLLFEILNNLLHYCFPMLNHINQDIDNVEKEVLKIPERKMGVIMEILRTKRNIVTFRKTMQAHKSIITKMINKLGRFFPSKQLNLYLNNLVNHTKDIWDFLENYQETINAIHETHQSLVSNRMSDIIKTLTIFSVIIFPLTLVATIFSMNTVNGMPLLGHQIDFWLVITILIILTGVMIGYFRRRKWL